MDFDNKGDRQDSRK